MPPSLTCIFCYIWLAQHMIVMLCKYFHLQMTKRRHLLVKYSPPGFKVEGGTLPGFLFFSPWALFTVHRWSVARAGCCVYFISVNISLYPLNRSMFFRWCFWCWISREETSPLSAWSLYSTERMSEWISVWITSPLWFLSLWMDSLPEIIMIYFSSHLYNSMWMLGLGTWHTVLE